MERFANLSNQVHDASIALKQSLLALNGDHRKPAGANGLKIDKEHAAELIAMRGQKRLHAGAVAVRSARCNKPDIVTKQLIVAHRGNSRKHVFVRGTIRRRGAALPTAIVILEVIPRAYAAA